MNLLKTINEVIKKESHDIETRNEIKKCETINRKANINALGQIQFRTISASGNVGTSVNVPMTQQRPKNLIEELNIKYLKELGSNFVYPLINGNISQWVNELEDATINDVEFESLSLQPNRLVSYVEYSKDVVLNPSTDIANAIQEDLINSVFDKVQETMFNDIIDSANTISISGTDDIIDFEYSGSSNNISNGVYLISPLAAKKLKKMLNGNSPIYQNGMINGYKVIETPSLKDSNVIFGDFSKLLLAQWGSFDITIDDVTKANKGIIKLIINTYWNWGMIDNKAFIFGSVE